MVNTLVCAVTAPFLDGFLSYFVWRCISKLYTPIVLTLTYLGYFASLNSWGGGGGAIMAPPPPPKISTMDGPINLQISTDTE